MKVFVTGASGWVGSAVVSELINAGHQVLGLARSDASAAKVASLGADVQRGTLDDLDVLRRAADGSDAVIHTAFVHDFSNFNASCATDRVAIETLGEALAGSNRTLIVTSGLALRTDGIATENDPAYSGPDYPRVSEATGIAFADRGVRAIIVRLPSSVHGNGDTAFVPAMVQIARDKGAAAYVGDGQNRWASVHRLDAARLYRLALESAPSGARVHAVADEGVPMRAIAAVIGEGLRVPVTSIGADEAGEHFGWIGQFVARNMPASAVLTKERYGWEPRELDLLTDMKEHYF